MANYTILATEVNTDPLTRGYDGMTDQEIVDDLNTNYRNRWIPLSSAQVFEAIVRAEFQALLATDQARIDRILGLGDGIQTVPGANARDELIAVFGGGSTTISNLSAIANPGQTRGREIGWGVVTLTDVQRVRV